jgi:hypothetical protein
MATDPPSVETAENTSCVGSLPETIGSNDLDGLNQKLETLLEGLRVARSLPAGDTRGRLSAVVALGAVCTFLMSFRLVLAEGLHVPLLNLHGALLALNENNIEPILKPVKRTGRAVSSPQRFNLIGIAIGSALRLEWTDMGPAAANEAIAAKLTALGVKPTRGRGGVTGRTVRGWRERVEATEPLLRALPRLLGQVISSEDLGWISAARNTEGMLTEKWSARIRALTPSTARRLILDALENSIRKIELD